MTINEQIQSGEGIIEIALTEDVTENVIIPIGKTVELDLAGFRLSNYSSDDVKEYTISNYGTLVIKDSGETGTIYNDASRKGCLVNHKGGIVTITGGSFQLNERAKTDSWYYIVNLGKLMTIENALVEGTSPNTSTVRNGFYTVQETTEDYIGEDVSMIINGGRFVGPLIPVKNDNHGNLTINGGTFEGTSECVLNWNVGKITGGTFNSPSNKYCIFSGSCAGEEGCNGELDVTGGTFIGGAGILDLSQTYDPDHEYPDSYAYIAGGKWEVSDKANVESFIKPGYEATFDEEGNIIIEKEIEWTFPNGGIAGMGFMRYKNVVMHNDSIEYEAGGFDIPIRYFTPVCIVGCMAKKGCDAYYNKDTKKIQLYRNGVELNERVYDVTIVMIGQ